MKSRLLIFFCSILITSHALNQSNIVGVWKGAIFQNNVDDTNALVTYFSISKFKSLSDIQIRIEKQSSLDFAILNIKGLFNEDSLYCDDIQIDKKNKLFPFYSPLNLKLKYNDSTGYLEGLFRDKKNNNLIKKVRLFKTNEIFPVNTKKEISHAWFYKFQKEYLMGMVAPDLRDFERNNFQFQSIYFEPTKFDLNPQYFGYLDKLIRVINGHTDLRLKIIGHTDWNGSDQYNEELSKKRAETIIHYLEKNGLKRDRIEFEFKGEKKPIDSNETPEGRKRNRRVDFEFI